MSRRLHIWKIRARELTLGDRTLVVGILNVTPDSFSDGGDYLDPDRAYARAMQMEEEGADIIDIGAESTRPGAHPITAAEELQRLVPVLKRIRDKLGIPVSVDTYKAEVAERALELGVEIINDPSGFTLDPLLAKPVVQYDAGVIFNHMRGRPETWAALAPMPDVMGSIVKDLDASVNRARRSGVDRARIVVDPGIGFGKRREQNSEILARLGEMTRLELPIMVGASRKSFLAQPGERETEFATAAAVAASVLRGAHMVRVHDVAAMKAVVTVADEIMRATQRLSDAREAADAEQTPRRSRPAAQSPQIGATAPRPPVRPPLFSETKSPHPKTDEGIPPGIAPTSIPSQDTAASQPSANFRKPLRPRPDSGDRPVRRPADFERKPSRPASGSGDRPPRPPSTFRERSSREGSSGSAGDFKRRPTRSASESGDRPSRPPSNFRDRPPRPGGDFKNRSSRPPGDFKNRPPRPPSNSSDRPSRPPSNFRDRPPRPGGDFKNRSSRPPGDFKNRPPRPPSDSPDGASRPSFESRGDTKGRPFQRTGDPNKRSGPPSPFRPRSGGPPSGAKKRPFGPRKGGSSKPPFRPKPRRDD